MESIRKIRAIVEFSPAKGSNQSYSVYSVVLHISLEEKTENLKQAVSEFWDKLDHHQQWSKVESSLPKNGSLKILAIKEVS